MSHLVRQLSNLLHFSASFYSRIDRGDSFSGDFESHNGEILHPRGKRGESPRAVERCLSFATGACAPERWKGG